MGSERAPDDPHIDRLLFPDVASDIELNDILRLMDNSIDPSDSMSFDLDSILPQENGYFPTADSSLYYDSSQLAQPVPPNGTSISGSQAAPSKSSRLPDTTTKVLRQWFENHAEYPYPNKNEKSSLAKEAGLQIHQVSTWFSNARRRRKRGSPGNGPLVSSSLDGLDESRKATHVQDPAMCPLDRWRNSPPELEGASLEAIVSAVASSTTSGLSDRNLTLDSPGPEVLPHSCSQDNSDARSLVPSQASGSVLSSSSESSAHSFGSNRSHGSFNRFYLNEPPRRRHRRPAKSTSTGGKPPKRSVETKRPFQCTFCTDTFLTKHDWTRHEKTLHLSLEKFTCSPFGSTYRDQPNGDERCAYCDEPCPSRDHIEAHRVNVCQQKPVAFRTFYRKDHLTQHLRIVHGINSLTPSMEGWKSQVIQINSRCGFCGQTFVAWSERNDHLAQHFRAGAVMKDWHGCRGLDPPVALAVENAMPPYLIGMESAGIEPFSASRVAGGPPEKAEAKPTSFEHLTSRLTSFVNGMRAKSAFVTDAMLQKEARCIMYGDDDPWNQTPADNSQWLKLFKDGLGLDSETGPLQIHSADPANQDEYNFCLPWSADEWAPFS
ncbi:uncharacterized protein LDX57_010119 [Aspergillus melleus]|uniref:uncharacterized protein n=1 Tax=Aspergillus melleus TaxID=138277 RepID=UPI001E8DBAE6|nr:uncharacterized protein LDX57_010119 [Aspergillus melleus]KAH8432482.1 hypothetical protein LDX57_010119 [Aspergillus melleus]